MTNDDSQRSGERAGERPPIPNEVEAVAEFETAPQVVSSDPRAVIDPAAPAGQIAPPGAVESFDAPARPPAGPAESTRCPRCGTENQPGIAFCRNCGQRLVAAGAATVQRPGAPEGMQTCPRCGTVNRMGVAFCQNCGAGLSVAQPGAPPASPAYVPPAVSAAPAVQPRAVDHGRAVLGPIVLIIGAVGLAVAWALPFAFGDSSLFVRALGPEGYGINFWTAYPDGTFNDQAYFGAAAAVPALVLLLVLLAFGGFARARPGPIQVIGLLLAFLWAAALAALFIIVEVLGADAGAFTALLRALSPAGIIFFLSSIVVVIGTLTRFARS